jgi:hypothetical protein
VIGVLVHATLHCDGEPVCTSFVQSFISSHDVGHGSVGLAGSHVSPASTVPLPQLAEQSESDMAVHALGQQPSPGTQASIATISQRTLHVLGSPVVIGAKHLFVD